MAMGANIVVVLTVMAWSIAGAAIAQQKPDAGAIVPLLAPRSIAALTPGTIFRDCSECPEMVVIPAGAFTMGALASERGYEGKEAPRHQVGIARPFAAGRHEVTFDEWDACVQAVVCANPTDSDWGRGRRPVINISWNHARQYVQWLSRKTGRAYRLLSEAEWEYVARAGTTTPFSTGASVAPTQANYNWSAAYVAGGAKAKGVGKTFPVGSFPPNAFGLFDVHGNVWEWTEDCGNLSYAGSPADGRPRTDGDCGKRVVRGGAWNDTPEYLRSAARSMHDATLLNKNMGFRVARTD